MGQGYVLMAEKKDKTLDDVTHVAHWPQQV